MITYILLTIVGVMVLFIGLGSGGLIPPVKILCSWSKLCAFYSNWGRQEADRLGQRGDEQAIWLLDKVQSYKWIK